MSAPEMRANALPAIARGCEECGGRFTPARRWARFCKPGCRNEWHRKAKLGPEGRLKELERRIGVVEALAHPAFDFTDLVRRLEALEKAKA